MKVVYHFLVFVMGAALLLVPLSCTAGQETFNSNVFTSVLKTTETGVASPQDTTVIPERGFYMGVLPVPCDNQTFQEAFQLAGTCADFVPVWGKPTTFYELPRELRGEWGRQFVETYTRGNGMFPLVHMSFIGPDMTLVSPTGIKEPTLSHPVWREAYKKSAVDIVRTVRPLYLSLGNEVNRWYEAHGDGDDDPNAFRNYVSLYRDIYQAVKEISPETQVFCTFAREIVSGQRLADMNVFRFFDYDDLDIIAVTSYPYAVAGINTVNDIPDDYYSLISSIFPGKPFGFTEVSWPSMEEFGGEQGQVDFLAQLIERLTIDQGVNLVMVSWSWLTDLDTNDTTGMMRRDGTPKEVFHVWRTIALLGKYVDRESAIPADTVKMIPQNDSLPPVLHSEAFTQPVPLPYPVNTAGAEDSPFVMPDGSTLYIWFTPDPSIPPEKQLLDGVTGIYVTRLQDDGTWSKPARVVLNDGISLDGCVYVNDDIMWFGSARPGYLGIGWFTAELVNGIWQNWEYAGDEFPDSYEVGELHFSANGKTLYFHSPRDGGQGQYDIWVTQSKDGTWELPENLRTVNSAETDGWPFVNEDCTELWFTRTYQGSPAIYVSRLVDGVWGEPEVVVSQFAGEPTLDAAGNLYFVHHYYENGVMLEADIFVAYRK